MSKWMEGLLTAERMGYINAHHALMCNEFEFEDADFTNGVMDYISHARRLEALNG